MSTTLYFPARNGPMRFISASSRRYIVAQESGDRIVTVYRTDDLQRAIDKRAKVGGTVFDTLLHQYRMPQTKRPLGDGTWVTVPQIWLSAQRDSFGTMRTYHRDGGWY